ncbi:MAG TPA: divalent-cation tolerance protein CutA [Anaerolineaceae bacterium]|nr:divalent-cation tolerance protein CutA [Anaerolineaceae bacterium]
MEIQTKYVVVLVSVPNEEVGVMIARALIEQKLAACVNILPGMRSIYRWEDRLVDDREMLLLVKTRAEGFQERLAPAIKALHPYDLPEIIALPIVQGTEAYLAWVEDNTKEA